jgi:hypothetical protein
MGREEEEDQLDLAIWRFGDLAIWRFGDLAIWRLGDLTKGFGID